MTLALFSLSEKGDLLDEEKEDTRGRLLLVYITAGRCDKDDGNDSVIAAAAAAGKHAQTLVLGRNGPDRRRRRLIILRSPTD